MYASAHHQDYFLFKAGKLQVSYTQTHTHRQIRAHPGCARLCVAVNAPSAAVIFFSTRLNENHSLFNRLMFLARICRLREEKEDCSLLVTYIKLVCVCMNPVQDIVNCLAFSFDYYFECLSFTMSCFTYCFYAIKGIKSHFPPHPLPLFSKSHVVFVFI